MNCPRNIHNGDPKLVKITVASLLGKSGAHTFTTLNESCVTSAVDIDTVSDAACDTPHSSSQPGNKCSSWLENLQERHAHKGCQHMSTGHEQSTLSHVEEATQDTGSAVACRGIEQELSHVKGETAIYTIEAPGILRLLLPSGKIRMLKIKGEAKFRPTHATTEKFKSRTRFILILLKLCMDGICEPEEFADQSYREELLSDVTDLSITSQKSSTRDNMPSLNNLLDILSNPDIVNQHERKSTQEARYDYARRIGRLYRYSISEDFFRAIHPDDLGIIRDYIQVYEKGV